MAKRLIAPQTKPTKKVPVSSDPVSGARAYNAGASLSNRQSPRFDPSLWTLPPALQFPSHIPVPPVILVPVTGPRALGSELVDPHTQLHFVIFAFPAVARRVDGYSKDSTEVKEHNILTLSHCKEISTTQLTLICFFTTSVLCNRWSSGIPINSHISR
ncbi:hypothetical protein MC885_016935, partial [Smutsia gigantea]